MKQHRDRSNVMDVASSNKTLSLMGGKKRDWMVLPTDTPVLPSPRVQPTPPNAQVALLSPLSCNGAVPSEAEERAVRGDQSLAHPITTDTTSLPSPSPNVSSPAQALRPSHGTEVPPTTSSRASTPGRYTTFLQGKQGGDDNGREARQQPEVLRLAQEEHSTAEHGRIAADLVQTKEGNVSCPGQLRDLVTPQTSTRDVADVLSSPVETPMISAADQPFQTLPATMPPQYRRSDMRPAKRHKKSSSVFNATMIGWVDVIDNFIARNGGVLNLSNTIERPRFDLLRNACCNNDCFYIALHQIYCVHTVNHAALLTIPGYEDSKMTKAFQILDQLIRHNQEMRSEKLVFFASFPNDINIMTKVSEQYAQTIVDVFDFLMKLAAQWDKFTHICRVRGYPPTIGELLNIFALRSVGLQGIVFTATRRNIGIADDNYGNRMEQMFEEDKKRHREWMARMHTDRPPGVKEVDMFNNNLMIRYQKLANDARMNAARCANTMPNASETRDPRNNSGSWPNGMMVASPVNLSPSILQSNAPVFRNQMPYIGPQQHATNQSSQPLTAQKLHHQYQGVSQQNQRNLQSLYQAHRNLQITPNQRTGSYSLIRSQQQPSISPPVPSNNHVALQNMCPAQDLSHACPFPNHQRTQSSNFVADSSNIAQANVLPPPTRHSMAGQALPTPPPQTPLAIPVSKGNDSKSTNLIGKYNALPPMQRPIIPPFGWQSPPAAYNPDMNTVHQSYLRSPVMISAVAKTPSVEKARYYQMINGFAIAPQTLSGPGVSLFSFTVSQDALAHLVEYQIHVNGTTISKYRRVTADSLQYRLRCVSSSSPAPLSLSQWATTETTWPKVGFFLEVNESVIDIRRKSQHQRDIPVDITPFVAASKPTGGVNQIQVSQLKLDEASKKEKFQFAIEIIGILSHQEIMTTVTTKQRRPRKETLKWIKSRLSSDDDDEIQMVTPDLTIGIRCPFTATLWDTPVRGSSCLHAECFDLETFLLSRPSRSKFPSEPCMVDVWKCPHCLSDARPEVLVVDEWMVEVKERLLTEKVASGSAFLLVDQDGNWRIKPEVMTGTGMKRDRSVSTFGLNKTNGSALDIVDRGSPKPKKVVEVIELDDD